MVNSMRSAGGRATPHPMVKLVGADFAAAGFSTFLGSAVLAWRSGRPRALAPAGPAAPLVLSIVYTPSMWAESYSTPLQPSQVVGHDLGDGPHCNLPGCGGRVHRALVPRSRPSLLRAYLFSSRGWNLSRRRGGSHAPQFARVADRIYP